MMKLVACLVLLRMHLARSDEIRYYALVEGTLNLRDPQAKIPATEIVLNGGEYKTVCKTDGTFSFYDVKPGVYLLDVLSVDYFFSQIKINLPKSATSSIQCLEYKYPGAAKQSTPYPIRLTAHGKKQYFDKRESMGLQSIFKNPMILMLGFTGVMVLIMPKLMENMDPEEVKKMQATMGASQDPASFMKHMFGLPNDDDDAAADDGSKASIEAASKPPTITFS